MIENLGYRVLTTGSGPEALEIFKSQKNDIALVILDMIMPGMSGEETFDRLKDVQRDIKVILSSGYSLNGHATGIMAKGCRAFLQKPFLITDLSRLVRDVLDGESIEENTDY
jgi:CheY-like chemotaxis protein